MWGPYSESVKIFYIFQVISFLKKIRKYKKGSWEIIKNSNPYCCLNKIEDAGLMRKNFERDQRTDASVSAEDDFDIIGEHQDYEIDRDLGEDATFFEAVTGKEGATFESVVNDLLKWAGMKKKKPLEALQTDLRSWIDRSQHDRDSDHVVRSG
jgi:hypothetical protein